MITGLFSLSSAYSTKVSMAEKMTEIKRKL